VHASQYLSQKSQLLTSDFNAADNVMGECAALFGTWRQQFGEFATLLRKLATRRNQHKLPIKCLVDNRALEERVLSVRRFRRQHEQLRSVIVHALPSGGASDVDAAAEIAAAYAATATTTDVLAQLDAPPGASPWDVAVRAYDERVERVEAAIAAQLRERLATAESANEMFRVCSKFNALFFRPRVRGAIREYQAQLIARVTADIRALHDKFKQQYPASEASYVATLRDVPPVSGAIIWARQLERQLNSAMARVENVLGQGWQVRRCRFERARARVRSYSRA
jgi:dynein heavy chain 1